MFYYFFISLILSFTGFLRYSQAQTYDVLLKSVYNHSVPLISPDSLHEKLRTGKEIVLLDTRSEREFEVSHLQGAVFLNFDDFQEKQLNNVPKDETVVVYCTVGVRSEKVGEKLLQAGYKNVFNLYGGIFEWVNKSYPVVNEFGPTYKVHAYSRKWGIWLQKGEKVYE